MERRLFLRLWAGLTPAMVLPLDVLERAAVALDGLGGADPGLVDGLEAMTASLVASYFSGDPGQLLPLARVHANTLRRRLDEPTGPAAQRRLLGAFTGTAYLAGRLAFVLDQRADALAYLTIARDAATELADPAVEAGVLNGLSVLHSALPKGGDGGDPVAALVHLEQAGARAEAGAPLHIRAWIAARTAYEAAAAGDLTRSRQARRDAERYLERADPSALDESLDTPVFVAYDARANLAAADMAAGEAAARVAASLADLLAETPADLPRRRGILVTDLAAATAAAGDLDEACRLAADAWGLAVGGYPLGRERVRGVRRRLRPWDGERPVLDLDERMAMGAGA